MSGRLRRAGGGRDQRPALDVMLKAATRGEFDDVAAWSVDRLGRSLQHLLDLTGHLGIGATGLPFVTLSKVGEQIAD